MSPDPLSPIAPLSSVTATVRAQPLPEDRPVAAQPQTPASQTGQTQTAQTQTAQTQAAAAAPEVEAAANPAAAQPAPPARDPVARAMIDSRETAAARQTSLAPLFADLTEAAAARQPTTAALPADVRAAVDRVLSQRLSTQDGVSAQALRDAVARSGLFLEANLAAGPPELDTTNDLKAALLNLRQTLAAAQQALGEVATADPAAPATPASAPATSATSGQAPTLSPNETPAAATQARAAPANTPPSTAQPSAAQAATSPLAVSQSSLLLAAQAAETPETAGALLDPAVQAAQRSQQQAQVDAQVEALRQTAAAASPAPEAEVAASPTATQTTPAAADGAVPTPAQTAAQNALALAQQAAAQAAQLAAGSATAQRTINQSSLLLAAQAAAIKPDDDEPSPLAPRLSPAREAVAPVEGVAAATPPPPVRGSALSGQPPPPPTLPTQAGEAAIVRHLAEQVDQALARQALHQLASVPGGATEGPETASWMFEIPIATPQGTTIAQFEIDRDGRGHGSEAGGAATWRARFSLNFEPLGPVHVQLSQVGPRTAVNLWAEREGSLDRLHAQSADLARDLGGEVRIQAGAPQRPAPSRGQFVDRLT